MDCAKCKLAIESESDTYFECDGCWALNHMKCAGVKKSEINARKESKCLKIFCESCYANPNQLVGENMQKILKYVTKIDMVQQKQEEKFKDLEILKENVIQYTSEIKGHIDMCEEKLRAELLNTASTQSQSLSEFVATNKTLSYASIAGGERAKSLIVKPKNKNSNSEKTKKMLMQVVDPTSSGVNEIKTLSNGCVLLKCKTNEEVERIEKQLNEKEGEHYTTEETNGDVKQQVKIVGMTKKYENEELRALIAKQHLSANAYVRVLKVYSDIKTRKESFNAIVEFDAKTAKFILNTKTISIAWDTCKAFGYVRIKRCFKCLGYNHVANECKNKIACIKCGGEHKVEECKNNKMSCVNCVEYAKKNKTNLDTSHHAFAHKCWCTQQMMSKILNNDKKKK